jgi:conflict system pore-forming effector with SLATT domain
MFSLTIVDHIRLDSDHVTQNYIVHARAAERLVGAAFAFRIVIVALLAIATAANIVNLLIPMRQYQIASVVAAALALIGFAIYMVVGLEARVTAHRQFAHRLWFVAEKFRSLLAEIHDGAVDGPALMRRRDDLIHELHAIYECGFGPDQSGHETARLSPLPVDRAA